MRSVSAWQGLNVKTKATALGQDRGHRKAVMGENGGTASAIGSVPRPSAECAQTAQPVDLNTTTEAPRNNRSKAQPWVCLDRRIKENCLPQNLSGIWRLSRATAPSTSLLPLTTVISIQR